MLVLILLFLLSVVFTILLAYFFTQMDCDLEVLFASKFGKGIDKLKNKVVWITGSSSGVGEALAYVLVSAGAKVVLSGSNEERLEKVAAKCLQIQPTSNVLVLPFDITDIPSHGEQLRKVLDHFKQLDVLVNNAGKSQRAAFGDIDIEVDRALFEVNVFGLISLTRVVLKYFVENNPEGQFAVTSSTAGIFGAPMSASYTASKHALHGYFECLRNELGRKSIAISMLCLGPVHSNLALNVFTDKLDKKWEGRHQQDFTRMATDRCAYLMAVSIVNRIDQAWISIQPVLILHYATAYFPQITRKFFPRFISVDKVNQVREGNRG